MSLSLCLRFNQLPLQCLSRHENKPVVVLSKQRALRTNDCAASLGIKEGMGTATVRALVESSAIVVLERDIEAEQRAQQQLCCWPYSITPALYTFREDCLQLEIGGCLALFKGLDATLANMGIASRGYSVHYALAATPRAAWLLKYRTNKRAVVSKSHHE